jgi:predicted nicotinamide N-methyase
VRFQLTDSLVVTSYRCGARELQLELLPDFGDAVARIKAELPTPEALLPDDVIPYYGAVWPAAAVLAREVAIGLAASPGTGSVPLRVLELGAGLGLPSLVAASAGCEVIAVDANPDALALLTRNAARNGLRIETICSDWRSLRLSGELSPFDLILASDVLYESYHATALAGLASQMLKTSGRMLLTDPCRWHYQEFLHALENAGFAVDVRFEDVNDDQGRTRVMVVSAKSFTV